MMIVEFTLGLGLCIS